MICALEGPDRCGKSSVLKLLKERVYATFVDSLPFTAQCMPIMAETEARQEALWRHLYSPTTLYIVDRSFTLTPEVYAHIYDRKLLFDPVPWYDEQLIVYFDAPTEVLATRADETFDPAKYDAVKMCYAAHLARYHSVTVDASQGITQLAANVEQVVRHRAWYMR